MLQLVSHFVSIELPVVALTSLERNANRTVRCWDWSSEDLTNAFIFRGIFLGCLLIVYIVRHISLLEETFAELFLFLLLFAFGFGLETLMMLRTLKAHWLCSILPVQLRQWLNLHCEEESRLTQLLIEYLDHGAVLTDLVSLKHVLNQSLYFIVKAIEVCATTHCCTISLDYVAINVYYFVPIWFKY